MICIVYILFIGIIYDLYCYTIFATSTETGESKMFDPWDCDAGNRLTTPPSLAFCPFLQTLNLSDNQLVLPPALGGCALLRTLDLSFNRIASARALLSLRPCVRLETLALNDNEVALRGGYRRSLGYFWRVFIPLFGSLALHFCCLLLAAGCFLPY